MLLVGPPMPDRSRVMTQKKGIPCSSRLGFGVGLTTPHSKKTYCYESRKKERGILFDRPKPTAGCSVNGEEKKKLCVIVHTAFIVVFRRVRKIARKDY
jgi:hypothetical protein